LKQTEALRCVFDSVRSRFPVGYGFGDFERALVDWEVVPLALGGQVIGGVLVSGNEIHVGYSTPPGAALRRHIKETLSQMLNRYGFVKTGVAVDNARGLRFCKRLGFHETKRENGVVYLRCEKTNYG
jgi:hypothetical protein